MKIPRLPKLKVTFDAGPPKLWCHRPKTLLSANCRLTMKRTLLALHRAVLVVSILYQSFYSTVQADITNLPDLGDESIAVISPAQERKLGEDLMRRSRRSLALVDDPELNEYIQNLGQRLVSHSDNTQQDFRFFIINNPAINAFALPGGFVGVHTGLILITQNEAELASVLAHEIAHVTQRHIPRLIAESQRTTLPAMAAILASILLASSGHQGGEAAIALTSATVAQKGLNFTRTFEEEADRIGMGILARSSYDPSAMPDFFEHMQNMNRINDANPTDLPEFLRTHPITTNRIADARNRAMQLPRRQTSNDLEFQLARAKIRAFAPGNSTDIVRAFKSNLELGKYSSADAERYGYILALLRAKQLDEARVEVKKLIEHYPNKSAYRIVQAEIEMAVNNFDQALAIYAFAYTKNPSSQPLLRSYADALLKAKRPRQAKKIIKIALQTRPNDPELHQILSQAAGGLGNDYEAHYALAEYYYLNGDLNGALKQLQIATRYSEDNFYLQSVVEARIRVVKEEIAEAKDVK